MGIDSLFQKMSQNLPIYPRPPGNQKLESGGKILWQISHDQRSTYHPPPEMKSWKSGKSFSMADLA